MAGKPFTTQYGSDKYRYNKYMVQILAGYKQSIWDFIFMRGYQPIWQEHVRVADVKRDYIELSFTALNIEISTKKYFSDFRHIEP